MTTIEQELAEIVRTNDLDMPLYRAQSIAKAIISSGFVIPVSALDDMVEKVAESIELEMHQRAIPYPVSSHATQLISQAAINAIKQEIQK